MSFFPGRLLVPVDLSHHGCWSANSIVCSQETVGSLEALLTKKEINFPPPHSMPQSSGLKQQQQNPTGITSLKNSVKGSESTHQMLTMVADAVWVFAGCVFLDVFLSAQTSNIPSVIRQVGAGLGQTALVSNSSAEAVESNRRPTLQVHCS